MKQRLAYVDVMRGVAILLVVLGHIYLPNTMEGIKHPIASMIYSFHMSFFFFLSGYINQKVNGIETLGWKKFVVKKSTSLLIPYLFWLIIAPYFLHNFYPHNIYTILDLLNFFPNQHFWFLPTLYIFMILYLCLYKISELVSEQKRIYTELTLGITSICIIAICGIIYKQYHLIIYGIYWFSFLFGNFLSKYQRLKGLLIQKSIFGISALLLCLAWKFYPLDANGVMWKSLINLLLSFSCSTLGIIVFYNYFTKAKIPNWIQKYLQEIGKYSLVIYLVPVVLIPHNFHFSEYIPNTLLNLIILAIGILHTLISYIFARVVFEIPYLRYIMFGKK